MNDASKFSISNKARNIERHAHLVSLYESNPAKCRNCKTVLPYAKRTNSFCNHSCAASYNNVGVVHNRGRFSKKPCKQCGTLTKNLCCSLKCRSKLLYETYISRWKSGLETGNTGIEGIHPAIRKYLFEKYDSRCSKCGWSIVNVFTKRIPLTINHIDGDPYNTVENNLELICPNCHSLTEHYGSRNKGKGRKGYRYLKRLSAK